MARYRTYKNGIFGHRYKGFYIIRGKGKGKFEIWNEDKSVFQDSIYDYEECEWIIDKVTADESTMLMLRQLYDMEIYKLSELFVELMQKRGIEGKLEPKYEKLYDLTEKVRWRKAGDREF